MRTRILAVFLLALVAASLCLQAQDGPAKTGTSEYGDLVASLKGGATIIDYAKLRLSYMDSPEYKNAKNTSVAEKAMSVALNAKDYPKALKNADEVLASDYVNIDAHFIEFIAHREMGHTEQAEFHKAVFRGLLTSIQNSGDGLSAEKAWVVINDHEEYVVLRALGYMPGEQSLMHKNGHAYDVMKVKKVQDGTEQTFYFNVDIPMAHGL